MGKFIKAPNAAQIILIPNIFTSFLPFYGIFSIAPPEIQAQTDPLVNLN